MRYRTIAFVSFLFAMQAPAQITVTATGKKVAYDRESQVEKEVRLTTGGAGAGKCLWYEPTDIKPDHDCVVDRRTHTTPSLEPGCPNGWGEAGEGYGLYFIKCRTFGSESDWVRSVSFDKASGRLKVTGKICRHGNKTAVYHAKHIIYQKCRTSSEWTQQYTFDLPAAPGWTFMGDVPEPPAGVESSTVQYTIVLNPATAAIAGLFETTPADGNKGRKLFAKLNPTTDLTITAMEVTQGIQNLANEMPLLAKRRTVIRAYVRSTNDPLNGIGATLTAYRNGVALGADIASENTPAIRTDGGKRLNLEDSFWFQVPPAWRDQTGAVKFAVTVDPGNHVAETNESNNTAAVDVIFSTPTRLTITPVSFHMHEGAKSESSVLTYKKDHPTFVPIVDHVYRFHPVSSVVVHDCGVPVQYPAWHALGGEWDMTIPVNHLALLVRIARLRFLSGCGPPAANWVGLVHPAVNTKMPGFNSGGMAIPFRLSSWVKMSSDVRPAWLIRGGANLAHELGHNAGLLHVKCAGDEGFPVADLYPHPLPDCRLAVGDDGYYGFDVYFDKWGFWQPKVISNNPNAVNDQAAFPMMGYRSPEWPDPFDYCWMLASYGIPCNPFQMGKKATTGLMHNGITKAKAPATNGYLTVSGVYDVASKQMHELQVEQMPTVSANALANPEPVPELRGSLPSLTIAQINATGKEIAIMQTIAWAADGDPSVMMFLQTIPLAAGTRGVRIRHNKAVLAERRLTPHRPTVLLVTPNSGVLAPNQEVRWNAIDLDGDALSFNLLYSPDAGKTWRPLAIGLRERSARLPEAGGLPGSRSAVLRVEVNDGFHTTFDDSNKALTAPTSPPVPTISQRDGLYVDIGRTLILDGTISDIDEGFVDKPNFFRWSSDRDGSLGTGPELYTRTLSRGAHEITLQVRDSEGKAAKTYIRVYVGVPPPIVDQTER
jgi:hypothetical protein